MEQGYGFQRKSGKRGQAAEKTGNQQQLPLRVVDGFGKDSDKKSAYPVGKQVTCGRRY